jgi:hypothetical protein
VAPVGTDVTEAIIASIIRVTRSKSGTLYYVILAILNFLVRFEVFTAVTMKNGVFWDVTPCGSCKNRRFGGT